MFGDSALPRRRTGHVLVRRFAPKISALPNSRSCEKPRLQSGFLCVMLFSPYLKFFRDGNSHGSGAGTHARDRPRWLGRLSGNGSTFASRSRPRRRRPVRTEVHAIGFQTHIVAANCRSIRRGGKLMKTRAAVALEKAKPLTITEVELDGPKAGEVLVEVKATGICHTDEFTLSGADPEGLFPAILGHEGAGIVVDVGPGVTSVKKGDHVIPLYTPECRQCPSCLSRKTNLCTAIRATQGQGVMPDGTSRFSFDGKKLHHYMGTSTFSNFTVLPEIAVAKIREDAP